MSQTSLSALSQSKSGGELVPRAGAAVTAAVVGCGTRTLASRTLSSRPRIASMMRWAQSNIGRCSGRCGSADQESDPTGSTETGNSGIAAVEHDPSARRGDGDAPRDVGGDGGADTLGESSGGFVILSLLRCSIQARPSRFKPHLSEL